MAPITARKRGNMLVFFATGYLGKLMYRLE